MNIFHRLIIIARPYAGKLYLALLLLLLISLIDTVVTSVLFTSLIFLIVPTQKSATPFSLQLLQFDAGNWLRHLFGFDNRLHLLLAIALLLVIATLFRCASQALAGIQMQRFALLVARDLRNRLFAHIVTHASISSGDDTSATLYSRISADVQQLQQQLGRELAELLEAPFALLLALILMLLLSWKMTLATLILVPVLLLAIIIAGKFARKLTINRQNRFSELYGFIGEQLANIRITQAFCAEEAAEKRVNILNNKLLHNILHADFLSNSISSGTEFLTMFGVVASIIVGGLLVHSGEMPAAHFVMFFAIAPRMSNYLLRISRFQILRQQITGSSEYIFAILDSFSTISDLPQAISLPSTAGNIEFQHVSFSYIPEQQVLRDFNLNIAAGETIALVGASGAGKSTIFNLLLRFFDPQTGGILIDGKNLREITLSSLRQNIAIVPQEAALFQGTIYDNIRYGNLTATREEITAAAKAANADEFIRAFPDGYNTIIGERGALISGGQRQRIAIARAIVKKPTILLLDEATSTLDSESEEAVQQALNRLMIGRTSLVIAHRLSTIYQATRIVLLNEGTVAEIGTHQELLQLHGQYHKLHQINFQVILHENEDNDSENRLINGQYEPCQ